MLEKRRETRYMAVQEQIIARLRAAQGHEGIDVGAHALNPEDGYPDFVIALA